MAVEEIKIDNKKKTIITNDWLKEFISYKKYRPQAMEKIVGPLSFGIGYDISYGVDIRIAFSVFNLTNPLDFMCATLKVKPKSRRKAITWQQHEDGKYKEAAQELRTLSNIPIEGPVHLSQIIEAYKTYPDLETLLATPRYFEDPALIAAWAGKPKLAMECLEWGKFYYDKKYGQGINFDKTDIWYEKMLQKIHDPEGLRQTVEDQIVFHKLTKLPREELIID